MPAAVANVMVKAVQPISDAKDRLVGHVFVPPQVMTTYLLSSRPIQWIIPQIVSVEDMSNMELTVDEVDTTESEGNENEKESSWNYYKFILSNLKIMSRYHTSESMSGKDQ